MKWQSVFVVFPLLLLSACGPSEVPTAKVKGEVKLGDQPLSSGQITFSTPGLPPQTLDIRDGTFTGELRVGKKRVEIYAFRKVKLPPGTADASGAVGQNFILPEFNADSKLEADVTENGPNEFQFTVRGKP